MNAKEFIEAPGGKMQETKTLLYAKGFKYQSRREMVYQTEITPDEDIITDFVILRTDGWMWVSKYFAWDGCSGPTYDDNTNMRAGHCHDALYYLFRNANLALKWRPKADSNLHRIMKEDGALHCRANYYRWAVENFARSSADPSSAKKVLAAP